MKRLLFTLMIAGVIGQPVSAFAIYKCEGNGTVTYSDSPCPGGKPLDIGSIPPSDLADARRRADQEKQALSRIENERRKQEVREEKERRKSARARAALERKCAALERRRKWAAEDAASAAGKSAEKAKRKARRAEELFDAECKGMKTA
jgi:hypothetical protein